MDQYMEIISASDAWQIADEERNDEDDDGIDKELKPTHSARRVKALVEQVTGMNWLIVRVGRLPEQRLIPRTQIVTRPFPSSPIEHVS